MPNPLRIPSQMLRAATSRIDRTVRSPATARFVADWEDRVADSRHQRRLRSNALTRIRILVHRGWIDRGTAKVHVRVVEAPELPGGQSAIPYADVIGANIRRHMALAFREVEVTVTVGGVSATGVTDRHGFTAVRIPLPDPAPGWHEARATVVSEHSGEEFTGVGHVLNAQSRAPFTVISDIDDTVMRTGLDEGLVAVRRTLMRDAHSRTAVPGMASLYRGLERGVDQAAASRSPQPAFFYVSTGSWSFYEMLVQFLQLRGFPRGPLFLTDWGPTERYLHRDGAIHKSKAIQRLADAQPDSPLVLIGDSGQADAELYVDCARANPGRVALIIILRASEASTEATEEWRGQQDDLRAQGIPFHLVDDAAQAARICHARGMVDEFTIPDVETEMGAIF